MWIGDVSHGLAEARFKVTRSRLFRATAVGILVAVALVLTAGTFAQGASYYYASEKSTPEARQVESGIRSSISGSGEILDLGVGTVSVETYFGYPGYTTVSYASAPAGYEAYTGHETKKNAQSHCWWNYHGVGGNAPLTCRAAS